MDNPFRSFDRLLAVTAFLFLAVAAGYARPLAVTFFDVEEADAVCIQTPEGRTILIDGGSAPYVVDDQPVQSREVLPLLKQNGITRLDVVIMSHSHGDHTGGLVNVLSQMPVGTVISGGYSGDGDLDYHRCMELIRQKHIPCHRVRDGERLDWGADITVEAFCPPQGEFEGANNNSLIIRMRYAGRSFLFTGDAQRDEEDWAVRKYGNRLRAEILKVAHHGSGTSTSRTLLKTVQPRIAVISCGMDNPFGHPHAQTLFALKKHGVRVYRTDYDGTIRIIVDGERMSVEKRATGMNVNSH